MSKQKQVINLKSIQQAARKSLRILLRYSGTLFFVLVAVVYGFVLLRINTLSGVQPSDSDVSAQAKSSSVPNIDPKVIQQLESLKDNSTNVQSLFKQARDNPFGE